MKKLLSKFISVTIILGLFGMTNAEAFFDLNESDKNYEAINYLQENNIIQGYEDGTFKPSQSVTRAEFTKILIKANFPEEEIINCHTQYFSDVKESDWFYNYVCIAKKYEIIQGYQDLSFKPDQNINQVEALKIVGETQNWELNNSISEKPFNNVAINEWFTPYVSYAKNHNYLEENDSNLMIFKFMSRANISELIYRSLKTNDPANTEEKIEEDVIEEDPPTEDPETPENQPLEAINFTPLNYQNISKTAFSGIILENSPPNTFYKNEVYLVKGSVSNDNYQVATIVLNKKNGDSQRTFEGEVKNGQFEIPIYFSEQGNYELGILPGNNGQYQIADISVLPNLPESTNNTVMIDEADNLNIGFKNDQTFISYDSNTETLNKVYFEQGNKKTYFISRQEGEKIYLDYRNFEGFKEGNVEYHVESAKLNSESPLTISSNYSVSDSKTFYAVEHSFDEIFKDQLSSTNIPDSKSDTGTISFSGTVLTDCEYTALIITPEGLVETKDLSTTAQTSDYFGNKIIPSGSSFSFSYKPSQKGRYIIEINNKNGEAALNHPVYVGGTIPLIPDFFDLNDAILFKGPFDLSQLRTSLLAYINSDRKKLGLGTIVQDTELNNLAQAHSEDQVERDFFGHVNPDGEGPGERRIAAGIKTAVGENVALSPTLEHIHYGLMRSAAHRQNILNPSWTRVGLGIKEGTGSLSGHLIVTQEFSTHELSENDLSTMKDEAFTEINQKRESLNLDIFTKDPALENSSAYMNGKVINEGATITSELFEEALQANNVNGPATVVLRTANTWSSTLDSILNNENSLTEPNWKTIGLDIQLDFNGLIYTIFTLNNPS
ncbi:S-layer homology domain-containing protein [Candidatus Peregrinibacteria bacterium]|nr:S-layer homology domain-containing protein [Candidatus Peregrinibacteria bacterium]